MYSMTLPDELVSGTARCQVGVNLLTCNILRKLKFVVVFAAAKLWGSHMPKYIGRDA